MGSDAFYPEEAPAHDVEMDGFWIDRTTVTNAEFSAFVAATGYLTTAERPLAQEHYPGVPMDRLVPGSIVFRPPETPIDLGAPPVWWVYAAGASWRCPDGDGTSIADRADHPVVHITFHDASAYARWLGKALPSEAQWEYAARGGLVGASYCWGGLPRRQDGSAAANIWQGTFPGDNAKEHPPRTEAVASYDPNGYGLYDMAGNVWEWTSDFFAPGFPKDSCCAPHNPRGPTVALAESAAPTIPMRTLKGGSFLCADNYCHRYRPAARIPQAEDSSTVHIGFRCVDISKPEPAGSRRQS
jgi:formylglycine-generating enzyme required for sulfatase activity